MEVDAILNADPGSAGHPGPVAEDLTDRTHAEERKGEADAHAKAIQCRGDYVVFVCEHLGAAEDDAVYDDERQEYAERAVKRRGICLDQELDDGHKRRNDNDIARDADGVRDHLFEQRDYDVGADQNNGSRKAHAKPIDRHGGDRKGRTGTEDQHQNRVFFDNTIGQCCQITWFRLCRISHYTPSPTRLRCRTRYKQSVRIF